MKIKTTIMAVLAVLAVLAALLITAPASAAPKPGPGTDIPPPTPAPSCTDLGVVSVYGVWGDPIPIGSGMLDEFQTSMCTRVNGAFKIYRSAADTEHEVAVLRALADRFGRPFKPALFCSTGDNAGRLIDHAQGYVADYGPVGYYEARAYERWVRNQAAKHPECTLYESTP